MGYFKRKLDRSRSQDLSRSLIDRAVDADVRRVWEAIPESPPRKHCYLRFSIPKKHSESHCRVGIFSAAFELLIGGQLDQATWSSLRGALDWFNENLDAPDDLDEDSAIFLFKSDAGECIRRIWDLVWILRESGITSEMQRVERPGRFVYEDAHQVAAIPWSDSGTL